jgi:hypothetical protein
VGCEVHDGFLDAIRNYCKRNDAALLILLSEDPASIAGHTLDKKLQDDYVVFEDTKLNSNLFISTIKLSAKHIDPTTSLGRIGQRSGSFIYASPKQRLKVVPVSNQKLPHICMTTGAITTSNYKTERYLSERTAYIAEHDHVMGAVVIEIKDSKKYFFRQLQAEDSGAFIDLGVSYQPNGKIYKENPIGFVLGDWHAGSTDPLARKVWAEIIKELKPETLVLHDFFDGQSINPHERGRHIERAKLAEKGRLNLEAELSQGFRDLSELSQTVDNVVVVKSNHDEFLERYLNEGLYVGHPENHRISLLLAYRMLSGEDPLKAGIEYVGGLKFKNVRWLARDEDFKLAGIQCGAHGDKGANGSKGNVPAMEAAYGNCITGHTHVPEILRDAWSVGTSSYLKLSYNKGPSSWLHGSILIYNDGSRQLIITFDGEWRL